MKIRLKEITEERYDEMLNVIFPAVWSHLGFLLGEPYSQRTCQVTGREAADYNAFFTLNNRYYESLQNLTVCEYKNVCLEDLKEAIAKLRSSAIALRVSA